LGEPIDAPAWIPVQPAIVALHLKNRLEGNEMLIDIRGFHALGAEINHFLSDHLRGYLGTVQALPIGKSS
jgi:hypothetical protein